MKRSLTLYNTLTRRKEPFTQPEGTPVRIYTCGPTVYGAPHIGNYRTYIFEDILVRTLLALEYPVLRVMNITDVGHLTSDGDEGEDKLEVGARREGITAWDVARKYETLFFRELTELGLLPPDQSVRATDTIGEQIAFIQTLEAKGHTYRTDDGIYFDSTTFPRYGALAQLHIDGQQAGIRVEQGSKRHGHDFALWKFSLVPGKRDMEWDSPWGPGFPGWHIECSAIIRQTLGVTVDIHCGGVDHIPIHHTNEIAQSESLTEHPLARFWLHGEFLLVDGGKMSKSLGNVYTLPDLVERGYDPRALRLFCYSALYRSKLNFTWESLDVAQANLEKLRSHYQAGIAGELSPEADAYHQRFLEALADDLNTPVGLAVVWEAVRSDRLDANQLTSFLHKVDATLQLDLAKPAVTLEIPSEIQALLKAREQARQEKRWDESDRLRVEIESHGFTISDTPTGQQISR